VKQRSEWIQAEVLDLRVVTDELWERVQQVNRKMKDTLYGTRVGGLNRSAQSRTYLFSPIQRTSEQYIGISTPLAGIILNPSLLAA
jgi:hypothetical protein